MRSIIEGTCVFSSCHDPTTRKGNLDLKTDPYSALVGVTPMNPYAAAEGWQRVFPGDHTRSFVWRKITLSGDDPAPPAGGGLGHRMPDVSGPPLDADVIRTIQDWIDDGAKNE